MFAAKKFLQFVGIGGMAVALCAMPAGSALADVKAGVDAWTDGNYEAAVRAWKPLADQGDPDAQFNLAQAYKMGRGVPLDIAKAEELYGRAAAKGHVQAADVYGLLLFQNGQREKAMPYVKAAAERGDPRAQYILGIAHFNGDMMPKDWVRAYALVSVAREAGLPQATNALAQMDQHIPLADRQSAVALSAKIAAETHDTRQRQSAAQELGTPAPAVASAAPVLTPRPAAIASAPPEVVRSGPASAGADYARPTPPPKASVPKPAAPPMAPAAKATPAPKPAPQPAPPGSTGTWRVQLGAFGVPANAEAMWAKVKGRPELAGHGKLLVPAGKLTKLQASGFATRAAAESACARLASGGFSCLPATN